jgi:hypothetical protein
MLNTKMEVEESQAVPAITPEMLSKLKKEDMKQAVVERFRAKPAAASKVGSPHGRPAHEKS